MEIRVIGCHYQSHRRRDSMYTTENCPFHCNTKDDPYCCVDCAANADYTDCVHINGVGLCGCAACIAYNRECPFENIRPVRCEWFRRKGDAHENS